MGLYKEIDVESGAKVKYWRVEAFVSRWECSTLKPGSITSLPQALQDAYAAVEAAKKLEIVTDIVIFGYVSQAARIAGLPPIYTTKVTVRQAPSVSLGADPRSVLYALSKTDTMFADSIDILE